MAAYALSAGHWAVITGVDIAPSALAQVDKGVNIGIQVALIVVIVASVGSILQRCVADPPPRAADPRRARPRPPRSAHFPAPPPSQRGRFSMLPPSA